MMPIQNKSYLLVTTAVAIVFLCCFSLSYSAETYEARCQTGLADGRQVDTCDSTKFLKCHDGRCRCADQTNQIWTYKLVKASSSSRSKRSPKKGSSKGSGKKIAAGVAAGAVGGYVASNIAHNIGSSGTSRGSSSGSSSRDKYEKVYSCYSRVQGTCILEGKQNGISIIQTITAATTTSSTTTAAPVTTVPTTNSTAENKTVETTTANSSQPAPQPQALAQVQYVTEYLTLPKCVEHAVCTVPEVKIVNGTVVSGASSTDARIGECNCQPGFKANNQDLCVKSGAGLPRAEISFAVLVCILISKLY